jgi:L-asparaginase II
MSYAPLVAVTRSGFDESFHYAVLAVSDASGRIVASAGDPRTVTFMRSSAKPLQALPVLVSGAAARFGFTQAEIAIIIGSHNGEPRHVETVQGILGKLGLGEDSLKCGTHYPYHRPTARRMRAEGIRPSVLHSNCSGKHSGMLALALARGASTDGYFRLEHPVQQADLAAVAAACGVEAGSIRIGIDGCTVPTFGMPVAAAAAAYARLMEPERLDAPYRDAAAGAVQAMLAHPEMVAGEDRLDTDLMVRAPGVIAKAGAEGYYAVGFRRKGRGYGLALKVADGNNDRARTAIVLRAMKDLKLAGDREIDEITASHLPPILNRRDETVGTVEARFTLDSID